MSRNPEYRFISTDTEEIVTQLVAMYEAITKSTVQPASPERLFIQWVANIIIQERVQTNYAGNQNIPSRAEGENLDALAELFYMKERPAAKAAGCKMRFFISEAQKTAILIPAGTRVTDAGGTLIWETLNDAYVPIGETGVEVPARCQTVGTVGNGYAIGQINKPVDLYDYYSECRNITVSGGGADEATDEEFYELMRASMDAYSCAGARGGYIYFAKRVSTEIIDVAACSPTPGVVKLYVLMKGGELAGAEIKRAVLAECSADEVRPLTDLVFVEDAETVPYNVDFTYYLESGAAQSASAVETAVRKAVEAYTGWQCARLGRDINPSRLHGLLMDAGVKRVELRAPVFTALRDGKDRRAPQVARVRGVSIVNGGYEDE